MYASSSHLAVSRNSSLSAWRFFFVNFISRILLFRPFRNEAGDYFVNDSRRESLGHRSSYVFFILRVALERFVHVEHDFRNIFRIYFIQNISQIKLCSVCSMSKNSILSRGFSLLNFFIPFDDLMIHR